MEWKFFLLRVGAALVLGALIGAERQLRQRLTGLRTNALVSTGACLFVLTTQAVPGMAPSDASRIAAYVVSGIGFLGGGVIMRDGSQIEGMVYTMKPQYKRGKPDSFYCDEIERAYHELGLGSEIEAVLKLALKRCRDR